MEKYRSTADPSTGVHPFISPKDPTSIVTRLACVIVLLPLRLLAIFVGAFWTFTAVLTGFAFGLVCGAIRRPFYRAGHRFGLRLVLLGLGVWRCALPTLERPRTRETVPESGVPPGHGDVVYCNHCSYLDPLFLACAYSPTFIVPSGIGSDVRRISLLEAVFGSLNSSLLRNINAPATGKFNVPVAGTFLNKLLFREPQCESLYGCVESNRLLRRGPLLFFAEGTTTNGRGVLTFPATNLQRGLQTFALGLSYSTSRAEAHTVGAGVVHILGRMTAPSSEIRGRVVRVPSDGNIQRSVASLAGIPPLRIGAEARARFEAHLREMANGY